MKLAIVGSRTFDNKDLLSKYIKILFTYPLVIISGGARGADKLGEAWALNEGIPTKIFYPNWNELGKKAGFVRNKQIVDACDMVLAFWDGKSKGTEHTIKLAREAKLPTFIVYF